MAAAEGVGAAEGDDLPVVETHAVEDGAEVGLLFCAVRETAVGSTEGDVAVGAAGTPGDDGTWLVGFCLGVVWGKGGKRWILPCISWIAATPPRVQRSE